MKLPFYLSIFILPIFMIGQNAIVKGKVIDYKTKKGIIGATVQLEIDNVTTVITDSNGRYEITVSEPESESIIVSKEGFEHYTKKLRLKPNEVRVINPELKSISKVLRETIVTAKKKEKEIKKETSTEISIDPLQSNPSGNVENNLKFQGMGVGGNSELGSQFSVRGGSFEENLIIVNDFEIYRPLLIRNAQQEGLSFANSQLINNMKFSSGGFAAEYGDKLSSVLDIDYKKPKKFAASIEAGLLGASGHLEANLLNKKLSILTGIRYRNNGYLLGSQETKGQYVPTFLDVQHNMHYQITDKLNIESLSCFSSNQFYLVPEDRTTNFGLINLALTYRVKYEGQERDNYQNFTQGTSLTYKLSDNVRLKYTNTFYQVQERQYFDIIGQYAIGEVESDVNSSNYGNFKNVFGSGTFHNWGREKYEAQMMHHQLSTNILLGKNNIKAGIKMKQENFDIYLNSWDRLDSAGYNIPNFSNQILLLNTVRKNHSLSTQRYEFYVQDRYEINFESNRSISFLFGLRGNYWNLNKEIFLSPRAQIFYYPKKTLSFYASVGSYNQPPFVRELINEKGDLNTNLKSQKSLHYIVGTEVLLPINNQPFKFTAEIYNKQMWDINPYQYTNVLLRYAAKNTSIAYARGIDLRLQGEFVKNAESWINIGIMDTKEYDGASFVKYRDSLGYEFYNTSLAQSPIVDTFIEKRGYFQRPNNQTLTFNLFFQDYLPKMPNYRVNVSMVLASGLPFSVPNNEPYRNAFNLLLYKRLDIGFSGLLIGKPKLDATGKEIPKKFLKSLWATLDIFNVVDFQNQVSMSWIQDYSGNQFAVPNYLTGRRINGRLLFTF